MLLVARSYDWHRKCHCEVRRFSKNMNEQTVKVRLKSVLYLLVFWGMHVQLVPEKVLPPLEYWVYFVSGIVIYGLVRFRHIDDLIKICLPDCLDTNTAENCPEIIQSFQQICDCVATNTANGKTSPLVENLQWFQIKKCPNALPSNDMTVSS